jgi:hypothetical protein
MAVSTDMDALLDKAYEDKSLSEILRAPVSALAGVSEGRPAAVGVQHQDRGRPRPEQVLQGGRGARRAQRHGGEVARPGS